MSVSSTYAYTTYMYVCIHIYIIEIYVYTIFIYTTCIHTYAPCIFFVNSSSCGSCMLFKLKIILHTYA